MKPHEALRWPVEGSFYARLEPLALVQMKSPGSIATGPGCHILRQWSPESDDEVTWFDMKGKDFRYLWFETIVSVEALQITSREPMTFYVGDVLLVQEQLLFIGPQTYDKSVHVLADWRPILASGLRLPQLDILQPGPGRKAQEPKTVYEHMREPIV
jgi:hypothetical protein